MCKIIAIANQKGGVGKTTTTSNLGIGLAKQGKKVLLIDADAQGSLTASLGFTEPDSLEVTLATIMGDLIKDNAINDGEVEPGEGILHHEEGIDLMPGNIELSGLEVSPVNVMSRETVLRSYIEIVRESYDYILIDCMPSLGMITINAFACADSILIPVQAAYLPVKGLQQLIKTVGKVKRQINPKLEIEGILLTMVDSRTNYAKDISSMLKEAYGSRVRIFANIIPISVRAAEISAEGVSIYKHDPRGKVASAYDSLTKEVLADGQGFMGCPVWKRRKSWLRILAFLMTAGGGLHQNQPDGVCRQNSGSYRRRKSVSGCLVIISACWCVGKRHMRRNHRGTGGTRCLWKHRNG